MQFAYYLQIRYRIGVPYLISELDFDKGRCGLGSPMGVMNER